VLEGQRPGPAASSCTRIECDAILFDKIARRTLCSTHVYLRQPAGLAQQRGRSSRALSQVSIESDDTSGSATSQLIEKMSPGGKTLRHPRFRARGRSLSLRLRQPER
jgi:hypothetical protein